MADKKYKVADGNAVVVKGVVLKPGASIPAGAVSAEAIKQLVAAKKIVEDKDAKESADDGAKSGAGGGKKGSKSDSGDETPAGGAGENAENGGGQA